MNFDGMDLLSPELWAHIKASAITLAVLVIVILMGIFPVLFLVCIGLLIVGLVLRLVYVVAYDHFSFKE